MTAGPKRAPTDSVPIPIAHASPPSAAAETMKTATGSALGVVEDARDRRQREDRAEHEPPFHDDSYSAFGRAAPKNRPSSLLTKPIRSYIASSVGSDAFRAFSAPRASSRCSSPGSARSSR